MKNFNRFISVVIICIFSAAIFAQEKEAVLKIEPYTKDNIPIWLRDLRRAEIVTFGSLPFTTLAVTLGYSLYRYGKNGFDPAYIPNPFPGSSSEARLNTEEQIGIILSAASLSILIGLIDFIVIKVKENKQKKQQKKAELIQGNIINIESMQNTENNQSDENTKNTENLANENTVTTVEAVE